MLVVLKIRRSLIIDVQSNLIRWIHSNRRDAIIDSKVQITCERRTAVKLPKACISSSLPIASDLRADASFHFIDAFILLEGMLSASKTRSSVVCSHNLSRWSSDLVK